MSFSAWAPQEICGKGAGDDACNFASIPDGGALAAGRFFYRCASYRPKAYGKDHPIMFGRFFRLPGSRTKSIENIVRQVAEASAEGVIRLVRAQISGMGPFEARGYIRARVGVAVRRHARAAAAAQADLATPWETIAAQASERVAPLVLRKLAEDARKVARHRAA